MMDLCSGINILVEYPRELGGGRGGGGGGGGG